MSEIKRKRRPGAGRKPLDPRGSVVAPVRFTGDDWEKIKRLATKHRTDCSKEIRAAVGHWLRMFKKPEQHIGALTCLITILVQRIEARTGRKWTDDPMTGKAVAEGVERIISHFAPTPVEPVTVPSDVADLPWQLITVAENLYPRSGVPEMEAELLGDDWAVLARIVRDLGSGWGRNRAVWMREMKS